MIVTGLLDDTQIEEIVFIQKMIAVSDRSRYLGKISLGEYKHDKI